MTNPKPRATAAVTVVARGRATVSITVEDDSITPLDGSIERQGDHSYNVLDTGGAVVGQVQQYARAGRVLAVHYGVVPRFTLRTIVDHEPGAHLLDSPNQPG